jgi:hypothetical protein
MSLRTTTSLPQPQGLGEDPLSSYLRIFTRFLQLVFASFEKGSYQWSQDFGTTDIVIQGEGTVQTEVVEKRPAIVVSRGPVAFTNLVLDQFAGPLLDAQTGKLTRNLNLVTGERRHTEMLSASVSYNCLSKEGLEAQGIAWRCAYATRVLKRALLRVGMHRVGEELQVGSESPPGSIVQPDPKEIIMVPVGVPFYFQQTWTDGPLDKTLLNRVALALRSEVGYSDPPQVVLRAPGLNGQPLQVTGLVSINQALSNTSTGGTKGQ